MIKVVKRYGGGGSSSRSTWDRKHSFDSGSTNYVLKKRVKLDR